MQDLALLAGLTSTVLFVVSYLPMLYRALRTRDLRSYSRPSLVLANVGNVIQAVYVYSLPVGPIWYLHGFYLGASALMLGLHLRHHGPETPDRQAHLPQTPLPQTPLPQTPLPQTPLPQTPLPQTPLPQTALPATHRSADLVAENGETS